MLISVEETTESKLKIKQLEMEKNKAKAIWLSDVLCVFHTIVPLSFLVLTIDLYMVDSMLPKLKLGFICNNNVYFIIDRRNFYGRNFYIDAYEAASLYSKHRGW